MITIYKYPFQITDYQKIRIKKGNLLNVGLDVHYDPAIWVQVDTEAEEEDLELFVVGTGRPVPEEAKIHLGSFNMKPFVWHLYTS